MTDHNRRLAPPKLIVALDVPTKGEAIEICESLMPDVDFFKVGLGLFCAEGPGIIRAVKDLGALVFLDLKLHDIPEQIRQAADVIGGYGVDMITVHCLGGPAMLSAARTGVDEGASRTGAAPPLVVGVTILTSLDEPDLEGMGVNSRVAVEVGLLAGLAKDAGLNGVVASARELPALRAEFAGDFIVVTPGIRPAGTSGASDQKRTLTPREAVNSGASYLVVGRPITMAEDPRKAALDILEEIR